MKKDYENELRRKFSSIKSTEGHINLDKEKAVQWWQPSTAGKEPLPHSAAMNSSGHFLKSGGGVKYSCTHFLKIPYIHLMGIIQHIQFDLGCCVSEKPAKTLSYLYSRSNDMGIRIKLSFPKSWAPCQVIYIHDSFLQYFLEDTIRSISLMRKLRLMALWLRGVHAHALSQTPLLFCLSFDINNRWDNVLSLSLLELQERKIMILEQI